MSMLAIFNNFNSREKMIRSCLLVAAISALCVHAFKQPRASSPMLESLMAKGKPRTTQQMAEVAQRYIQMRELKKIRDEGRSYEEIKEFIVNGSSSTFNADKSIAKGYKQFVGKGNLDQRLRAVISYKRATIAAESLSAEPGVLTKDEENELQDMMDSDDDLIDEADDEEDEEAEYERLVMRAIETNKLNELKRNFVLDKAAARELNEESRNKSIESLGMESVPQENLTSAIEAVEEDELYTPARSTWGVFKRPKDISKTYGGGRVISREEMDRMDAEWEERELRKTTEVQQYMTEAAKKELDNADKIKTALSKSRGCMMMGNTKAAVEALESISELVSYQTDTGGEVLLELGMALETVDRIDDARNVYGKLASTSWSQKIRRNALQLIQGLDITKQIRSDVGTRKPAMDMMNMYMVEQGLRKGLTNEWDDFKKRGVKDYAMNPWFDDESDRKGDADKVETFRDAYNLLRRALNPLKKVSSELLAKSFRRMFLAAETEKLAFLKSRGLVVNVDGNKPSAGRVSSSDGATTVSNAAMSQNGATSQVVDSNAPSAMAAMTKALMSEETPDYAESTFDKKRKATAALSTAKLRVTRSSDSFANNLNGTWESVISIYDKAPYTAKRYEYGDMRRVFYADPSYGTNQMECVEIVPVFWGLANSKNRYSLQWNSQLSEITLSGKQLQNSPAPWQRTQQQLQCFQVTYCDDTIMVCRQPSDNVSSPDLYSLWKRILPTVWKKY